MSIIESIKQRRSVRSYNGEPLSKIDKDSILSFIAELKAPFGINVRIKLIHGHTRDKRVKLGTYGWISNASDFLVLIYEQGPLAEESAAYVFEELVLYCTKLGLGTCWLGGSFSKKDFANQIDLKPNEKLRIVSPVGYAGSKQNFVEKYIVRAEKHHASRKPFGTHFFYKNTGTPLTEELAGVYAQPLEMVRLAPSANNKQPWRVILDESTLHFYKTFSFGFDAIDLGIALCHFEKTCQELNIPGHFVALDAPQKGMKYSVSWISQ